MTQNREESGTPVPLSLVAWNAQGAFRRKAGLVFGTLPDIAVICECENEERLKFGGLVARPDSFIWHGDSVHKGLGVFGFNGWQVRLHDCFDPKFRFILPLRATGAGSGAESGAGSGNAFNLFAVWAMDDKENPKRAYIGQVWEAVQHYEALLKQPSILAGDFNSNRIWDKKARVGNHSQTVGLLAAKGIRSLYHRQPADAPGHAPAYEQGAEPDPTFYLYRHRDKPYHMDYCFASDGLLTAGYSIRVGSPDQWLAHSDHMPLTVRFM